MDFDDGDGIQKTEVAQKGGESKQMKDPVVGKDFLEVEKSSLDMLRALQWIGEAMIFLEINSFGIESI